MHIGECLYMRQLVPNMKHFHTFFFLHKNFHHFFSLFEWNFLFFMSHTGCYLIWRFVFNFKNTNFFSVLFIFILCAEDLIAQVNCMSLNWLHNFFLNFIFNSIWIYFFPVFFWIILFGTSHFPLSQFNPYFFSMNVLNIFFDSSFN